MDDSNEKDRFPTVSRSDSFEYNTADFAKPEIDNYQLLKKLGEGGMGIVYLAQQERPFKRQVALKVVKPGMDSKQVLARFATERQTLALLEHPNIARVFNAGTTKAAHPYIAMEYVDGIAVTKYCDLKKLNVEERLQLFLQICDAIQYAHQKGIIHRDIKPSNILVTIQGGNGIPKIIDFGVAKVIAQPLNEQTLYTKEGHLVGTPAYMSPEQAMNSTRDIDLRTDIYSLGVLLYELLTGSLPFDKKTLQQSGFAEIQRILREKAPPRPSTRLSMLGDEAQKIAQNRGTEITLLVRKLHKELEWIPLKAMRKEPEHRYRSVSELADDIKNYINGAPLIAGPESTVYRAKKFVRRNRVAVGTLVTVFVALIIGIIGTTLGLIEAASQRQRAESNFQMAQGAVDEISQIAQEYLADIPRLEQVRRNVLQKAQGFYVEFLERNINDPQVHSETGQAYLKLGEIHKLLGEYEQSENAYLNAIDTFVELTNKFSQTNEYRKGLADSYSGLARTLYDLNRYDKAEHLFRQALEIMNVLVTDFPENPDYIDTLAQIHNNLARLLRWANRSRNDEIGRNAYFEAESVYQQAITLMEKLNIDYPDNTDFQYSLVKSYLGLIAYLADADQNDKVKQLLGKTHSIIVKLASDFPDKHNYQYLLADTYMLLGQYAEKDRELNLRLSIDIYKKLVTDFPDIPRYRGGQSWVLQNLSRLLSYSKRYDEAITLIDKATNIRRNLCEEFPEVSNHWERLKWAVDLYVWLLENTDRKQEAMEIYRQLVLSQSQRVAIFPDVPQYRSKLTWGYQELGYMQQRVALRKEASESFRQAVNVMEELEDKFPTGTHNTLKLANLYSWLASLLDEIDETVEAIELSQKATTAMSALVLAFPDNPTYSVYLADDYIALGKRLQDNSYDEAEDAYRSAIARLEYLVDELPGVLLLRQKLVSTNDDLYSLLKYAGKQLQAKAVFNQAQTAKKKMNLDFPNVPQRIAVRGGVSTDLWDVSRGITVTAHSPTGGFGIRNIFGSTSNNDARFASSLTIFQDFHPPGTVHFVEWQTPMPITLNSFALYASMDLPFDTNSRSFSRFTLKTEDPYTGKFDLILYEIFLANPQCLTTVPDNTSIQTSDDLAHLQLIANIEPVMAQNFRAEFAQCDSAAGLSGPRIWELDGFGQTVSTNEHNSQSNSQ